MASNRVIRYSVTATSPAAPGNATLTEFVGMDKFEAIFVVGTFTGATGGALGVTLQTYDGATWWDLARFGNVGAGTATATSAFTMYKHGRTTATAVGAIGAAALAASTILQGPWGPRIRVAFSAAVGTSAGASQTITIFGTERAYVYPR